MHQCQCQCHQIGGPFIAEDPDCPVHGRDAQRAASHRAEIIRCGPLAVGEDDAGAVEAARGASQRGSVRARARANPQFPLAAATVNERRVHKETEGASE